MNEPKLRFKADDGNAFPDWEEKSVGDITIELKEYEQLNSGYPLMTSSRSGLMMQEDFRSKSSTEDDTAIFSVVTRGVATYRHMSDDNIFHFNINNLVDKGLVSKEYPVFNTVNGNSLYLLVEYLNSSKKFLNFCKAQKKGGTRTRLYFKVLKGFKFNVPSLPEQQKIADFLSTIDTVIEKQKATVKAWEERKKGVMQKLFSQEVRFKADDGSEFPDWEEKKIEDVATCFAGATPSTKVPEYWMNGTIQWMSSGEVNNGQIYETEKKISQLGFDKCSTKMVKPNTVVMALAGQGKTRGMVAITRTSLCTNQSLCAIETIDDICDDYLYQYLQTQYDNLRLISSGDGTRGGLNLKLVGGYVIKVPYLAEQQKIADCLSALDDVIEKQKATLAAWEEMKKGLLQQMFV